MASDSKSFKLGRGSQANNPKGVIASMSNGVREFNTRSAAIHAVGITSDNLTSRAGLSLFARYLSENGVLSRLEKSFGGLRGSRKGQPVWEIFKQVLCFLLDGSSRHLSYFDVLRKDKGYAATIESPGDGLLSSHSVKRFFGKLGASGYQILFRALLGELWLWRLGIEKPKIVLLGLDSMVMDNDEAQVRHGVKPTYKKVKGFHPLQLTWGRYLVDAVFRGGDKHCNHGDTAANMLRKAVRGIRRYDPQVPIIVRMDAGYFDQELFELCEELGIGFICTGKMYRDLKDLVSKSDAAAWRRYTNERQAWDYLEFGDRRASWRRGWRAFYLRPYYQDQQVLLEFARPESVLYTNLGMGGPIDEPLMGAGMSRWLEPATIIEGSHDRGADELVHRAFKDFGFEELPFERFAPNAALYYTMVVGFFLFEAFKYDVCQPVVPVTAYATTVRRQLLDIAGKIVRSGGRVILKVTDAVWNRLDLPQLWRRSANPPRLTVT
jgi:hypothetical protein